MKPRKICYVCFRITPLQVLAWSLKVWGSKPQVGRRIGGEACRVIRRAYFEKPWFFCGKHAKPLVAGLFYILGWKYDVRQTEYQLAEALDISEASIRRSYRRWMAEFPWLYETVKPYLEFVGITLQVRVGRPRNGQAPPSIRAYWRLIKKKR